MLCYPREAGRDANMYIFKENDFESIIPMNFIYETLSKNRLVTPNFQLFSFRKLVKVLIMILSRTRGSISLVLSSKRHQETFYFYI